MNKLLLTFLAAVLAIATFLLTTWVSAPTGPQTRFRLRPDSGTILFAVTPWGEAAEMKAAYTPLLNTLGKKLGKKFQLLVMEDYATAIDHIVEGGIDIFVLPPVSFVLARKREPGIRYIATQVREQEGKRFATYRAYLVALRSRHEGWRLDDFLGAEKKHRFGFVTKKSSSGWAYPMALMKRRNIEPEKVFREVRFFENHAALTDALVAGEIDLGATWEHNLEQARKKHGNLFTVVETTAVIPGIVWVASKNVSANFVNRLRAALLELHGSPEKETVLKRTPDKGWQVLPTEIYRDVEETLRYVGEFD